MPIVVHVLSEEDYQAWLTEQTGGAEKAEATAAAAVEKTWTLDELVAKGKDVYGTYCVACHGANGEGMPALNAPALDGSAVATGELAEHMNVVLHGRPGTAMAAFGAQLSDLDVAAVITFERNAWSNKTGDVVQPADIKAAR